jgi:hypothetical protein
MDCASISGRPLRWNRTDGCPTAPGGLVGKISAFGGAPRNTAEPIGAKIPFRNARMRAPRQIFPTPRGGALG